MKKLSFLIATATLVLWGCHDNTDQTEAIFETTELKSNNSAFTTFTVRIENIGTDEYGYPIVFAPGIFAVQKKSSMPLFAPGAPDFGEGLEAIAEDGNPGPLDEALRNHPKVRSHGTFAVPAGADQPGPLLSGQSYEFTFTAKNKDYLNFATMFVQSNDLFIAPGANGISLFEGNKEPIEGDITGYLYLWDAGTEVNEEPGVGPNQAPRQSGPDTGVDENGVVQIVNDGFTYPDLTKMIRVTISH